MWFDWWCNEKYYNDVMIDDVMKNISWKILDISGNSQYLSNRYHTLPALKVAEHPRIKVSKIEWKISSQPFLFRLLMKMKLNISKKLGVNKVTKYHLNKNYSEILAQLRKQYLEKGEKKL